jgi:hypothetical protein
MIRNTNYELGTCGRNRSWFILNYYLITCLQGLATPSDLKVGFTGGVRTTKILNKKLERQPTASPNLMFPVEGLKNSGARIKRDMRLDYSLKDTIMDFYRLYQVVLQVNEHKTVRP